MDVKLREEKQIFVMVSRRGLLSQAVDRAGLKDVAVLEERKAVARWQNDSIAFRLDYSYNPVTDGTEATVYLSDLNTEMTLIRTKLQAGASSVWVHIVPRSLEVPEPSGSASSANWINQAASGLQKTLSSFVSRNQLLWALLAPGETTSPELEVGTVQRRPGALGLAWIMALQLGDLDAQKTVIEECKRTDSVLPSGETFREAISNFCDMCSKLVGRDLSPKL